MIFNLIFNYVAIISECIWPFLLIHINFITSITNLSVVKQREFFHVNGNIVSMIHDEQILV